MNDADSIINMKDAEIENVSGGGLGYDLGYKWTHYVKYTDFGELPYII